MHTNVEKSKVAKAIGEEYKNWGHKDCIFIDAPTGSGKTTFILEILLPFLCHKNEKLLYLVNRRILKKQLEDTIINLSYEQRRAIRVELYQTVETRICNIEFDENKREYISKGYIGVEKFAEYDCVVCDECHYFITDSNYNTNTICSFRWVQDTFENKLSIFMSATINEIQSYIEKNNVCGNNDLHTLCYNIRCSDIYDLLLHSKHEYLKKEIKLYKIDRDYDYIDVKIIQSRTDIVDIVTEERDKWLIFVDKIKFGKELKDAIKKKFRKLDVDDKNIDSKVTMISSGYKHDKEGKEEVDRIIQSCAQSSKILIATSVLDNGVNIKDIELRNIIVIADTETTFIQMLGRKREDTQRLKLYIYKYNKSHFCKMRKQIERRKKIADVYLGNIEEKIGNLCKLDYAEPWSDDINRDYANKFEKEYIKSQSKKIMHDIAANNKKYNDISSIFNLYDGTLYLILLAFQNIENLSIYYNNIIEKYETEGEDAFLREQLSWIGKTDEEADEIISDSKKNKVEKSRNRIIEILSGIVGIEKSKEEFICVRNGIRGDLMTVVQYPVKEITGDNIKKWKTCKNELTKTGKPISKPCMEFLRIYCSIPFRVEVKNSKYTVQCIEENEDNK